MVLLQKAKNLFYLSVSFSQTNLSPQAFYLLLQLFDLRCSFSVRHVAVSTPLKGEGLISKLQSGFNNFTTRQLFSQRSHISAKLLTILVHHLIQWLRWFLLNSLFTASKNAHKVLKHTVRLFQITFLLNVLSMLSSSIMKPNIIPISPTSMLLIWHTEILPFQFQWLKSLWLFALSEDQTYSCNRWALTDSTLRIERLCNVIFGSHLRLQHTWTSSRMLLEGLLWH